MATERRVNENKALRELVDALKEFIAARDALWCMGFFDRMFRYAYCVETLNRYDAARNKVRDAILAVKEANIAKTDTGAGEEASKPSKPLVTLEEFEILLGDPVTFKNRPQGKRPPP